MFYSHYIALQEKILPFLSVNDAVKLPQETTPLDELEAEIVPIPYGQVTDKSQLRADSKREAVSGAAAARSRGQQSVQVLPHCTPPSSNVCGDGTSLPHHIDALPAVQYYECTVGPVTIQAP
jgi:hypothetical protein